jgi:hypothetical protein
MGIPGMGDDGAPIDMDALNAGSLSQAFSSLSAGPPPDISSGSLQANFDPSTVTGASSPLPLSLFGQPAAASVSAVPGLVQQMPTAPAFVAPAPGSLDALVGLAPSPSVTSGIYTAPVDPTQAFLESHPGWTGPLPGETSSAETTAADLVGANQYAAAAPKSTSGSGSGGSGSSSGPTGAQIAGAGAGIAAAIGGAARAIPGVSQQAQVRQAPQAQPLGQSLGQAWKPISDAVSALVPKTTGGKAAAGVGLLILGLAALKAFSGKTVVIEMPAPAAGAA